MKINTSHLIGAAIALVAVFFSKLDVQSTPAPVESQWQQWEYRVAELNEELEDEENGMNLEGYGIISFELVAWVEHDGGNKTAVFKRPKWK